MTVNYGMSSHFLDTPQTSGFAGVIERFQSMVDAQPTGCNSAGLNSGLTTAILGVSASYYERASPIVVIRGERTRKLQNLFRRAAGQAALPEPPPSGTLPTNAIDRSTTAYGVDHPNASTSRPQPRRLDFHQTHGQACNYNIPAQLWDNSKIQEMLHNYSHYFGDDGDPNK